MDSRGIPNGDGNPEGPWLAKDLAGMFRYLRLAWRVASTAAVLQLLLLAGLEAGSNTGFAGEASRNYLDRILGLYQPGIDLFGNAFPGGWVLGGRIPSSVIATALAVTLYSVVFGGIVSATVVLLRRSK